MDLIHQPLNGMRDFTSERFRREIAHVQEDGARMREHRRGVTIFSEKKAKTAKFFDLCCLCGAQHLIAEGIFTVSHCTR